MNQSKQFYTAGETATLIGVSTKALRIYERHHLVVPERSRSGYRLYGPLQMSRLHQILGLKSLGLTLAQIGQCLREFGTNLRPILEAQEKDLSLRIQRLETTLAVVKAAQVRLAEAGSLSVDDLINLTKETVMSDIRPTWRESLAPLFDKHFSEIELQKIMSPAQNGEKLQADATERERLLVEARALLGRAPTCPEALELARRWRERAVKFTGDDPNLLSKFRAVFDEALSNPEIARTLPWRDEMLFIKAATECLESVL